MRKDGNAAAGGWDNDWRQAVTRVTSVFAALPATTRETLERLARAMVAHKEALQAIAATADAGNCCAGCGGACCVRGKYHFAAADLLVYLATAKELFAPRFENGLCPYLGEPECLIPAGYRPFNCITFNCDLIEDRLPREEVSRFYRMEGELKEQYAAVRSLFPNRSMDGPLL